MHNITCLNRIQKKIMESMQVAQKIKAPKPKRTVIRDETCDAQSKKAAYNRAVEVSASLPIEFPGFVKSLCASHVTSCFCFGVPKEFRDEFMPKQDETMFLVDEDDQEFKIKFLSKKGDFGSGWQRFVIDHKLRQGDALVFRLIEQWKVKVTVYIVRRENNPHIDGALEIVNVVPNEMNADLHQPESSLRTLDRTNETNQENAEDQSLVVYDQPGGDHEADAPEGLRFAQSVLEFQEVKSIDDFSIVVDGLLLDSLIPENFIIKYYDLCKSQNAYLHENLLKGLNTKATAGIIHETVTIADAIRACKPDTAHDDLDTWDKTLESWEKLGMKVGFLRARISKIVGILFKPNELLEVKRNVRAKAQENEKTLSKRLHAVRGVIKNLDHEIESLKRKGENLEAILDNEVNAPW
ncbi:B3 domain-containing protein Os01g0234100-like [Bidens hawaiensis]|uniref:B3 domain-containing protein Os01g0234100-like n=1 Tax=Bidens hawaiensis TaxID=980011 RepID=UPI0040498F72